MASTFIPNSFQMPNAYIDRFMALLTGEENKVLIYMARRIFGFQKREERITLTQMVIGTVIKGESKDRGTGLSESAVRRALAELTRFGFVVILDENDQHKNQGRLYSLELDSDKIDAAALTERENARFAKAQERTGKARGSKGGGVVGQHQVCPTTPGLSDNTRGGVVGQHPHDRNTREIQNTPDAPTGAVCEEFLVCESCGTDKVKPYRNRTDAGDCFKCKKGVNLIARTPKGDRAEPGKGAARRAPISADAKAVLDEYSALYAAKFVRKPEIVDNDRKAAESLVATHGKAAVISVLPGLLAEPDDYAKQHGWHLFLLPYRWNHLSLEAARVDVPEPLPMPAPIDDFFAPREVSV